MRTRFLRRERDELHRLLPGLDEVLATIALAELEGTGSTAVAEFRRFGGPGLLVPSDYGGKGAGALQAVRVQRAIAARSPSLGVATAMHHYSVCTLTLVSNSGVDGGVLLKSIATKNQLVASGLSESRSDGRVLAPSMAATPGPDGLRITGIKRPCSLAHSMDLLAVSVLVPAASGTGEQLAVAVLDADDPGVVVNPFWSSFALAAAESHQVAVDDVAVPMDRVLRTDVADDGRIDEIQTAAFAWFELMVMGSYLGIASALVERAIALDRVAEATRLDLVTTVESAMAAVENLARQLPEREHDVELLVDALLVRYAVQDAIAAVTPRAVELLGGLNFMGSDDIGYLAAAVNCLAFHPPSRSRMAVPLIRYFGGSPLRVG